MTGRLIFEKDEELKTLKLKNDLLTQIPPVQGLLPHLVLPIIILIKQQDRIMFETEAPNLIHQENHPLHPMIVKHGALKTEEQKVQILMAVRVKDQVIIIEVMNGTIRHLWLRLRS